jgi:rhodanese-related sulfurtransferase
MVGRLEPESNTIIVDVRTKEEFCGGHIERSINIPFDRVSEEAEKLREYEHVVVVCASGKRSAQATSVLVDKGLKNVFDGGGWQSFKCFDRGDVG